MTATPLAGEARHSCPPPDLSSAAGRALGHQTEAGASLVEYALLLGLIVVVAVGSLLFLGHNGTNVVNVVGTGFSSTIPTTATTTTTTTTTTTEVNGNQGGGRGGGCGGGGANNNGGGNQGGGNNQGC